MKHPSVRWGLTAWLVLRLITLAGAWYSTANLAPGPDVQVPGYAPPRLSGPMAEVAEPWIRGDARWYLKISAQGYLPEDGTLAFFPALPAVTRIVQPLVGNEAWAGLLAAHLASLAGLVMLFAFVARALNERAARAAVVGFALFPSSFFLLAPYGESMLLMAGAGTLLAAQAGKHGWSFVAGVVAGLSRPFGAAMALPVAAVVAARGSGRRRWAAPAAPAVGLGLWIAYTWRLTGDPLALVNVQGNWQRAPLPPWIAVWEGFRVVKRYAGSDFAGYALFDLVATLIGLALIPAVYLAFRRKNGPSGRWAGAGRIGAGRIGAGRIGAGRIGAGRIGAGLAAYGAVTLALPLSLPFLPRPLLSLPRFVLALFPLFAGLVLLPGKLRVALAVVCAAGLFVGTAVFLAGRPLF